MGITREIGAKYTADKGTTFTVWAPDAKQVEVVLAKEKKNIPLQREAFGYWTALAEEAGPGTRYLFKLDNDLERPDPASQFQPGSVHKASEVVDHAAFAWTDNNWKGLPLEKYIIYELHVGTFSEEGTFKGIQNKIPELLDLGITAIEMMPIAQFPGSRNWGYDGVYPFAAQDAYGGPVGLKQLVNACHEAGIAVLLDVVYNHMGPEGNYLNDYGPYFTDKYNTPWGKALNFDDAHSDHVRNFFLQNALMWLRDYHLDGLRLDAVHAILDTGARHFLQDLQEHVNELAEQVGRELVLIAESDMNDTRLLNPIKEGGFGLAAQWTDDYHHAVHTLLTGEKEGYYSDYGQMEHLVKALQHSFIYNGTYSEYRKRTLGNDATANPAKQFVVCIQNHDQVGNRMLGERLSQLISFEKQKVAAGLLLLSPYTPMLFMGEEYGEENPFLYFISHTDLELVKLVQKGRQEEFSAFTWEGEVPDPQSEETFNQSKLQRTHEHSEQHRQLREYYKALIRLRKTAPALAAPDKANMQVTADADTGILQLLHTGADQQLYTLFNISNQPQTISLAFAGDKEWEIVLSSASTEWGGFATTPPKRSENNSTLTVEPESLVILQSK